MNALVGMLLAVSSMLAYVHVPDVNLSRMAQNWLNNQKIPNGNEKGKSCCSVSDASLVEEDIRNGRYWMRCPVDSPCPIKEWTIVPEEAVITEPNRAGRPAVWWAPAVYNNGVPTTPPSIRCYAPGSGI